MKLTRTLILLMLALTMALGANYALADADVFADWGTQDCPFQLLDGSFSHDEWKTIATVKVSQEVTMNADLYMGDEYFSSKQINGDAGDNVVVHAGTVALAWNGVNEEGWHPEGDLDVPNWIDFKIVVTDENSNVLDTFNFTYGFAHTIAQHKPSAEAPWMWQNTVCSFGPHFRDIDPELTDKWYMFSAIDLSQDGVQTYELVAGGRYKIGNVTIAVNGDEVTVDYDYFNDLYVYNQGDFFTIFPDFDSITTVEPSELTAMEYGKTYSIANDLGGDTNVLLYTCNVVNFQTDIEGIERFYENIPWRKELRQSMLELAGLAE